MKPIDLYSMTPEKEDCNLWPLIGSNYNHIMESNYDELDLVRYEATGSTKIKIKYYKNHSFDGRRVWRLASVWFEENPVMVIRNAGREGDDFADRFITDKENFINMIKHLRDVAADSGGLEIFDPNADIQDIETFYGHSLGDVFPREGGT